MRKLITLIAVFIAFAATAQQEIEAKELSKKDIRALLKAEKRKKQIE